MLAAGWRSHPGATKTTVDPLRRAMDEELRGNWIVVNSKD